jgi:hypothetical protein
MVDTSEGFTIQKKKKKKKAKAENELCPVFARKAAVTRSRKQLKLFNIAGDRNYCWARRSNALARLLSIHFTRSQHDRK